MRTDPTGPRASPLDPNQAAVALEEATDRELIFELLLRAARSMTRFAALFVVHPDCLRGRRALAAPGLDARRVAELQIPRSVPAFEAVIESRKSSVGSIATGEPFIDGLLEQLGGPATEVLVVPIVVDARTAALVVAHRGKAPLAADDIEELMPLVVASCSALARGREKRARTVSRASTATMVAPTRDTLPRIASSARAETAYDIEVIVEGERPSEGRADSLRREIRLGLDSGLPDEDAQLELFVELARIEPDPERAIEAWRSALTIDGGDQRALDALHGLLISEQRWSDFAELLEHRIGVSDPSQRIADLLELAAISREHLHDDERAIAAYERLLHWDPDHPAGTELEELYTATAQWESKAMLLLDRASRELDIHRRVATLAAVAGLYEREVGDPRAACLVWITALRVVPQHADSLAQLVRLAPHANAWDELIAEGGALADQLAGTPIGGRLWQLVGQWARDHGRLDVAVRAFDRAYRIDPDAGAGELAATLRTAGRRTELIALLIRRAEREADVGARSELYAELGELHEELGDLIAAIGWYERAIADEPEARPVLIALHRLDRQTEAWPQLAKLLPQLIAVHDPATERARIVELGVELGRVLGDRLQRHDEAIAAYRGALALAPRHASAFHGIARSAQATGQTEAMLDAAESGLPPDSPKHGELAAAWHDRGRFDRAATCWRKVLAGDPGNAVAHDGLARALRTGERWFELVPALRAWLEVAPAAEQFLELAEILDRCVGDIDGAIAASQRVLALDPNHGAALDLLARLQDRAGESAIGTLDRLLALTTAPKPRAEVFQRLGHAYLTAGEPTAARLHLVQAIALDLSNAGAREGMARLHIAQDELVAAGEELLRAADFSATRADKLRRLADAAWLFRHRLRDTARARSCLEAILEIDPDHRDAKHALASLLADNRRWKTLWEHLEPSVEQAKDDDADADNRELYARAGRCALELDDLTTALALYDRACQGDAPIAIRLERADALARARSFDAAIAAYEAIHAIERTDAVVVFRRQAELYTTLGKLADAYRCHDVVLELDPTHVPTLSDLAELHVSRGRFDDAIANLKTIVLAVELAERPRYLERIGDLYRTELANPARATSAYLEALDLEPGNRRLLQRLLDLQSEVGQWRAAVETIRRFLEHEREPDRRAAYQLAEAEIRRIELRDRAGALEAYERAIDELFSSQPLAPTARQRGLATFRIIDELVTATRDWPALEQCYVRMIQRIPAGDPVLVVLWHALGELYRSRMREPAHAIRAFEVAHAADPSNPERAAVIEELYAATAPAQPPSARRPSTIRARTVDGQLDESWCAARALTFLDVASDEERALYERYREREAIEPTGALDDDSWHLVRHPDEDLAISDLFAAIWSGPVTLRAAPPKALDLRARDRLPDDSPRAIALLFRRAARILGVPAPTVYLQPRRPGRLQLANCIDRGHLIPAVIVGRDLLTGYRDAELAAAIGALVARLRPAYYLRLALPETHELEATLAAGARIGGRPNLGIGTEPLASMFATQIGARLTRSAADRLRTIADRLPPRPDLARWCTTVDRGADRAALLVAGDLAATARMQAPDQIDRVHDLVGYSVSPSYLAARARLGVAL